MLSDSFAPYYPWLWLIVLAGAPTLAGILWLAGDRITHSFHYDDRPPRRPELRAALMVGVIGLLLSTSAVAVWNPRLVHVPLGSILPALVFPSCLFYFSGRLRSLRMMVNQPKRVDGTILGVGWIILLVIGIILWASALFLALRMPHIHAFQPNDEAQRLGGLTAAAIWGAFFCGAGVHLRRTWRRLLAERRA